MLLLLVLVWLGSVVYLHYVYWRFLYRSKNGKWFMIRLMGYALAPFVLSEYVRQRKFDRS